MRLRIVDSHVHVWQRPHPEAAALWHRPHPVESLLQTLDDAGVDGAVQVTPSPEGWDNSYGEAVVAAHPARLRLFARVDPTRELPDSHPRSAGIRLTSFGTRRLPPFTELETFWTACEMRGTPVAVFAPDDLAGLIRVAERHPRLPLIVDHLGLGVYPGCPDPLAGLSLVSEFVPFPNVRVKISGLPEVSREPFPFRDVHDHLAAAVAHFGARRLIWGSNHPVVLQWCSYADSLHYLEACEFLTHEERSWIFARTLEDLLAPQTDRPG